LIPHPSMHSSSSDEQGNSSGSHVEDEWLTTLMAL
jgi:hypothetical protein